MSTVPTNDEQLRAEISARYARTALRILGTEQPAVDPCCGPTCCSPTATVAAECRKVLPVVEAEPTAGCCGPSCCSTDIRDANVIPSDLYTQAELGTIPVAGVGVKPGSDAVLLPHPVTDSRKPITMNTGNWLRRKKCFMAPLHCL